MRFAPALCRLAPLLALIVAFASACEREVRPPTAGGPSVNTREVILYCSADAPAAQPVLDAFTKKTGITVRAVFDTEATKTTGLVNRLLAEHESGAPRADVWWSSEPFGTIRLARAGVLEKYTSPSAEAELQPLGGWPEGLRGSDGTWYGFAPRLRVLVYNTKSLKPEDVPRHLYELTDPKFKDRIAMARPQFGTTRGHVAAIQMLDGGNGLEGWLRAAAGNGLRLYDGNATVVRSVAMGEAWLGLTDSDDALNGLRNGWPIGWAAISSVPRRGWSVRAGASGETTLFPEGAMPVPSTVAVVAGARHPAEARALVDFLLSTEAELMLAEGDFHAIPIRRARALPLAAAQTRADGLPASLPASELNLDEVAEFVEPAMRVCDEVLGGS